METVLLGVQTSDDELLRRLEVAGVKPVPCDRMRMGSDDEFVDQVKGHQYVISGPGRWNAGVLQRLAGSLRMAVKFGIGVDNMDLPAATRCGIAVSNAPGGNAQAVAEHAVALMLGIVRRLEEASSNVRSGVWSMHCNTLVGATIGIVGFGHIGRQVARFLNGFPVTLLACDVAGVPTVEYPFVKAATLDELVRASDVVSLHAPLLDSTRGMVNRDFLSRMKRGAYLINTSRGGLVNEDDLAAALQSGLIRGAALDTFSTEPLPAGSPFLSMKNVLLTPHCASNTDQAFHSLLACCIGNVIAFKTGVGDSHILNPEYREHAVPLAEERPSG